MDAKEYWDTRYKTGGNSGYGSYGAQLAMKLNWLRDLNISSIVDVGCGDFNFGKHLTEIYPKATYTGLDISEVIIKRNKEKYPNYNFQLKNGIPKADLVLCIDVLFHLLDDNEVEKLLGELEESFTKYLAITAYERSEALNTHVRIRKFDYKRFGEPIIREVVEGDGQMYFYLFKKPEIDLRKVSCCLNTKEKEYPMAILNHIKQFPFGEVLIATGSDSPYKKYELFAKAKYDLIYYQDDDCIAPINELVQSCKADMINISMDTPKIEQYKNLRMTMGFGWGSIFPKSILKELKRYTDEYGEDELFKRDTEKILTELVYPQNRVVSFHQDLETAMASDRLWREPNHWSNMKLIQERCKSL